MNIVLSVMHGQKIEDVAKRFGIPVETVSSWKEAYERYGPKIFGEKC